MTIESRPGRLLHPKPKRWYRPLPPLTRRPKLPIRVGKAQQMLSGAIILGDDEQASWVDLVVKANCVTGKPEHLAELKKRLDAVMQPLPDRSPPTTVT
jgi:hypothetical protein